MTREEAIANLNMISVAFVEPVTKEQRKLIDDTFDTAIKALEQEPVLDKIRAEINKLVIRDKYSQRQNDYCDGVEFMCNRIKEIIDKYKAESEDKE